MYSQGKYSCFGSSYSMAIKDTVTEGLDMSAPGKYPLLTCRWIGHHDVGWLGAQQGMSLAVGRAKDLTSTWFSATFWRVWLPDSTSTR